ncbi:MAG TPA: DUF5597 domain-containing protein [Bryobacteraceae bacterium]|nr:DUF5597 domain-containing protein [Bryobacteraceae bacterium]
MPILRKSVLSVLVAFSPALLAPALAQSAPSYPHLEKRGRVTQLIVDGKPFLALAGELHNSSASSMAYMQPIWPKLVKMNLNTVLATVSWDSIEPQEGKFDFSLVDGLLQDASAHHLHLVLLWFGSWKNGISSYDPAWVKSNQQRFPLVRIASGKSEQVLSTLAPANWEADARAFRALMRHVRAVDSTTHTVVMIQVENEVGLLGDSRDRSAAANEAFAKPVPKELMDYMQKNKEHLLPELRKVWDAAGGKTSGTWEDVFGKGTAADEAFMAWHYARYIDHVAEAGKAEYALPMYVNTWIVQPQDKKPGDYPSGGAEDHVHDIWQAGAPHIDILCPDIYLPNFQELVTRYSRNNNPLFIPESFAGERGAANAFYAFGEAGAIGYSPFGIEQGGDSGGGAIPKAYDVLSQLAPLIAAHQQEGTVAAVVLDREHSSRKIRMGDYTLNVELRGNRRSPQQLSASGYGLFLPLGPAEYLAAGSNVQVTFTPNTPGPPVAGLSLVEEGNYVNGRWIPGRMLNGDEIQLRYDLDTAAGEDQSGQGLRFGPDGPTIQRVTLYRY